MSPIDAIRARGFRRWYERALMRSHVHLLACFVCMVGLVGAFEAAYTSRGSWDLLIDVLAIVLTLAVGLWSLRRYLFLLMQAEALANQASCQRCGAYARLQVRDGGTAQRLPVACRTCGHEWTIEQR